MSAKYWLLRNISRNIGAILRITFKMQPSLTGILKKPNCTTVFGSSIFSLGIILLFLKTLIIELSAAWLLVLKPNSPIEEFWHKMPVPVPTDVYLFNWTNPEDIRNFSIKPKFEEVGPYRFMQNMEKVNIVWNDNNTVTFNQVRSWYVDEEHANGNLSDKVTTMNAVMLSTAHYIRNWNYFLKRAASAVMSTMAPHVHITKTVDQFLFEGYDDFIVELYNLLPFIASEIPRFDKFGWFFIRNASDTFDGTFNMGNGVNGDFEIHNWNYYNTTPYFNGTCAKVHGSGGELYSAKPTKDYIGIFMSDVCRYVRFDFEEEVMVDGILGYKYSMGKGVLDNGTDIPENECYCAGKCIPSGMFNISSCRYGLPTYGSLPNFYGADPIYLNAIEGLRPDKAKHESYIVLEPNTAAPLMAVGRLQLNVFVHPIEDISLYEDLPEVFLPLLWIEQRGTLPGYMLTMLKIYLYVPYVITSVGIILIIIGMYVLICIAYKPVFMVWYKNIYERKECLSRRSEEVPLRGKNAENVEKGSSKLIIRTVDT